MPTIVRLAKTTGELGDVLAMRYRAMLESGRVLGGFHQFTGRVLDHLDILPSTLNILAYNSGRPVAGLRAVAYSTHDNFLNLAFDFRETVKSLNAQAYYLDMFSILNVKSPDTLFLQLLKTSLNILAQRSVRFALFTCPPQLRPIAESLGFKPVQDPFQCDILGMSVCPMVLAVDAYFKKMIEGIVDKEILRFQEVFYSTIFDAGEVIVVEGERGTTAYLIEYGEVEVLVQKGEELIPISVISSGRMIGEVAMVTNETRTASLIAKTTTACISFDRHEFMKLMYKQPHRSLDIFKIFSKRLTESNRRLAESKS